MTRSWIAGLVAAHVALCAATLLGLWVRGKGLPVFQVYVGSQAWSSLAPCCGVTGYVAWHATQGAILALSLAVLAEISGQLAGGLARFQWLRGGVLRVVAAGVILTAIWPPAVGTALTDWAWPVIVLLWGSLTVGAGFLLIGVAAAVWCVRLPLIRIGILAGMPLLLCALAALLTTAAVGSPVRAHVVTLSNVVTIGVAGLWTVGAWR